MIRYTEMTLFFKGDPKGLTYEVDEHEGITTRLSNLNKDQLFTVLVKNQETNRWMLFVTPLSEIKAVLFS